jgi:hypothetical protein
MAQTYMAQTDFKIHLRKQLKFLEQSCSAYDAGNHDEGIRIATVMRILIHQTKNSTSLLKHLNSTTINLLTTVKDLPRDTVSAVMSMSGLTIDINGIKYYPTLGNSSYKAQVPVSKWWDQIIIIDGSMRLTRKKIVLTAANQDGGAHVDANLDLDYEQLSAAGFSGSISGNNHGIEFSEKLQGTNTICLRQMGYELLNSPELLNIVK